MKSDAKQPETAEQKRANAGAERRDREARRNRIRANNVRAWRKRNCVDPRCN